MSENFLVELLNRMSAMAQHHRDLAQYHHDQWSRLERLRTDILNGRLPEELASNLNPVARRAFEISLDRLLERGGASWPYRRWLTTVLYRNGVTSVAVLLMMPRERLHALRGGGPNLIAVIEKSLAPYGLRLEQFVHLFEINKDIRSEPKPP